MADFVTAQIQTDPTQLVDTAIDQINSTLDANGYPGWSAGDATLAVILLGVISQIAADLAQVAATVLPAIFRRFGTLLLGIAYEPGASATVVSNWTFTTPAPSSGYLIPAGTGVVIDGYAFYVQNDVTTAAAASTEQITLVASQSGVTYNDLGGIGYVAQLVNAIDWVSTVTTLGVTSGGADQEDDPTYINKLANTTPLMAPRPITAANYAAMVKTDLALQATGAAVGRSTSIDGYYPDGRLISTGGAGSTVLSCQITLGSQQVILNSPPGNQVPTPGTAVTGTGIPGSTTVLASPAPTATTFALSHAATATNLTASLTVAAMSGYGPVHASATVTLTSGSPTVTITQGPYMGAVPDIGARVVGSGVPAETTVIASPAPSSTGFTLSQNATSNITTVVTISSWTSFARATTTFVTDSSGDALTAASMDVLQTWLAGYREVSMLPFVTAPSYTTIYVSVSLHVLPGFSASAVSANVQSAIVTYLSPATWGNPSTSTGTSTTVWLNSQGGFNVVRVNSLIGVAEAVPGVQYVTPGGLTVDTSASPTGTVDVPLTGPAPLPQCAAGNVTVTVV